MPVVKINMKLQKHWVLQINLKFQVNNIFPEHVSYQLKQNQDISWFISLWLISKIKLSKNHSFANLFQTKKFKILPWKSNALLMINPQLFLLLHWLERYSFFFHFFITLCQKETFYFQPNAVQTLHYSLKNTEALLPKFENIEAISAEIPQAHFLLKLKRFFSCIEAISEKFWRFFLRITLRTLRTLLLFQLDDYIL